MAASPIERLLIFNAHIYGPAVDWKQGWLLTEGKKIYALGAGQPPQFTPGWVSKTIDAGGKHLLPGFIDLHVHGALGHEAMDASEQGLREMAHHYGLHGVTGFLATTWTASREAIHRVLAAAGPLVGEATGGANILGVHLEGPYLNPSRCGAQDAGLIRRADPQEAVEFLETGIVRLVALAPEFPENIWLVDECMRRGIAVSAGHTDATYDQMALAVSHGVRQVTHCFNAMSPFSHRQPGTVGAAMSMPEISCELIADNIHVHPAAQKVLSRAKGTDGVLLVTDAIRPTGLPDGEYPIDEARNVFLRGSEARLADGTLAGSVLTMDHALVNFMNASGLSLQQAWRSSSLNAARQIGLSHRKGSLEAGKDADLVLLDAQYQVAETVVEGRLIDR